MQYETLEVRTDGPIDWLTLNRPDNLNAINPLMCDELQDYFFKLQSNTRTRIVIFKGNGKHFCAGYDINDAAGVSEGPVAGMRFQRQVSEVILRMRYCPQPIINLSHGASTGGGLAFALACDVRIAANNVKFNVAMVKIGLTGCDVGISYFLPRAVGSSMAAEMMMTGRMVTAERALSSGLVSEIVALEDLEASGRVLADEMLQTSPMGLRLTKEGLRLTTDSPSLEAAIALEDRGQILCASAGFFEEGINAFLEKRPANYSD
ncbi:MAG: enoyl-CoA hydratase/isomerase family protein [Gammaproteobacteria bacterium]